MKRIIAIVLMLGLCWSVPVMAQDTAIPEEPTFEVFETATPFETPTAEPTATETATATPSPTPVPVPPIVDVSLIPNWVFTLMVVAFLAVLVLGGGAVLIAANLAPKWAVEMALSLAKQGVIELKKKAEETETAVDDLALVEFEKRLAKLEADYRAQPARMEQIAQAVVAQSK